MCTVSWKRHASVLGSLHWLGLMWWQRKIQLRVQTLQKQAFVLCFWIATAALKLKAGLINWLSECVHDKTLQSAGGQNVSMIRPYNQLKGHVVVNTNTNVSAYWWFGVQYNY